MVNVMLSIKALKLVGTLFGAASLFNEGNARIEMTSFIGYTNLVIFFFKVNRQTGMTYQSFT